MSGSSRRGFLKLATVAAVTATPIARLSASAMPEGMRTDSLSSFLDANPQSPIIEVPEIGQPIIQQEIHAWNPQVGWEYADRDFFALPQPDDLVTPQTVGLLFSASVMDRISGETVVNNLNRPSRVGDRLTLARAHEIEIFDSETIASPLRQYNDGLVVELEKHLCLNINISGMEWAKPVGSFNTLMVEPAAWAMADGIDDLIEKKLETESRENPGKSLVTCFASPAMPYGGDCKGAIIHGTSRSVASRVLITYDPSMKSDVLSFDVLVGFAWVQK